MNKTERETISLTVKMSCKMWEFCENEAKRCGLLSAQDYIRHVISRRMEAVRKAGGS